MSDGISAWFDRLEENNKMLSNAVKTQENDLNSIIKQVEHHLNMIEVHRNCALNNIERLKGIIK